MNVKQELSPANDHASTSLCSFGTGVTFAQKTKNYYNKIELSQFMAAARYGGPY